MSTGHPVEIAWHTLSEHAAGCGHDGCAEAVEEWRRQPEDPREADGRLAELLCEEGRAMHMAWWEARQEWLATTDEIRRGQGILALEGDEFDVRAAAIMSMPGPAFHHWLELPEERRMAELRALEGPLWRAVFARRSGGPAPERTADPEERDCAWEGCATGPYGSRGRFVVKPKFANQRYCSDRCRNAGRRVEDRPRARLEPSE